MAEKNYINKEALARNNEHIKNALDTKLPLALFNSLFEKVNIGTEEQPHYAIKAKLGLFSEEFISSLGANPNATGEGGGGAGTDLLQTWNNYNEATAQQEALSAYLGKDLYDRLSAIDLSQIEGFNMQTLEAYRQQIEERYHEWFNLKIARDDYQRVFIVENYKDYLNTSSLPSDSEAPRYFIATMRFRYRKKGGRAWRTPAVHFWRQRVFDLEAAPEDVAMEDARFSKLGDICFHVTGKKMILPDEAVTALSLGFRPLPMSKCGINDEENNAFYRYPESYLTSVSQRYSVCFGFALFKVLADGHYERISNIVKMRRTRDLTSLVWEDWNMIE